MKTMKLPKANKYGTISRKSIQKLIEAGMIEAKCDYHMTDDYAWDNANGFGKTDWRPCAMQPAGERVYGDGVIRFTAWDFTSGSGGCRLQEDGTYRFYIHSNLCYTLRVRAQAVSA